MRPRSQKPGREDLLDPERPVVSAPPVSARGGTDIRVRESPESSNIREAQFDPSTLQLVITFKNGTRYAYESFPLDLWMEYDTARSVGQYFAQQIRPMFTERKL